MGPKKTPLPPDAIAHRLEDGLTKADCEFVKEQFARYAVDVNINLRTWKPWKKDNLDNFLAHLELVSSIWAGLGYIDDIWGEVLIVHLRSTLKNQLRDEGAPMTAKMEAYRKARDQAADGESEDQQINTNAGPKKPQTPKSKKLGKRSKEGSRDQSQAKGTPGKLAVNESALKVPAGIRKGDAHSAGPQHQQKSPSSTKGPEGTLRADAMHKQDEDQVPLEESALKGPEMQHARRFNPTMFSTSEWAVVENELECQALWKEIGEKKRELKALYKKWQSCHSKSVYHTDPVPEWKGE